MFTRNEFVLEFDKHIVEGFNAGLNMHTQVSNMHTHISNNMHTQVSNMHT